MTEELAQAAALAGKALGLGYIGTQAIKRPRAEGQAQRIRRGERRLDHQAHILGRVHPWVAGSLAFIEASQSPLVEAAEPAPYRAFVDVEFVSNFCSERASVREEDTLRAPDTPGAQFAGAGKLRDGALLVWGQGAGTKWSDHRTPPCATVIVPSVHRS